MHYFLKTSLFVLLFVNSASFCVVINDNGLITNSGTITWSEVMSMQAQITRLRRMYFATTVLTVGYLIYEKLKTKNKSGDSVASVQDSKSYHSVKTTAGTAG